MADDLQLRQLQGDLKAIAKVAQEATAALKAERAAAGGGGGINAPGTYSTQSSGGGFGGNRSYQANDSEADEAKGGIFSARSSSFRGLRGARRALRGVRGVYNVLAGTGLIDDVGNLIKPQPPITSTGLKRVQDEAARQEENSKFYIQAFANAASLIPGMGAIARAAGWAGEKIVDIGKGIREKAEARSAFVDLTREYGLNITGGVNATARSEAIIKKYGETPEGLDRLRTDLQTAMDLEAKSYKEISDGNFKEGVALGRRAAAIVPESQIAKGWYNPGAIWIMSDASRTANRNYARTIMSRAASRTGD